MQTMQGLRRVTNPGGISGRDPDHQDRLVHLPQHCPFIILREMGSMVKVAVREVNTKAVIELFVQYRVAFSFSAAVD